MGFWEIVTAITDWLIIALVVFCVYVGILEVKLK